MRIVLGLRALRRHALPGHRLRRRLPVPAGVRHERGRGGVENTHSTDVEVYPHPPRVCKTIHPAGKSCFDPGHVVVPNDPGGRSGW